MMGLRLKLWMQSTRWPVCAGSPDQTLLGRPTGMLSAREKPPLGERGAWPSVWSAPGGAPSGSESRALMRYWTICPVDGSSSARLGETRVIIGRRERLL